MLNYGSFNTGGQASTTNVRAEEKSRQLMRAAKGGK